MLETPTKRQPWFRVYLFSASFIPEFRCSGFVTNHWRGGAPVSRPDCFVLLAPEWLTIQVFNAIMYTAWREQRPSGKMESLNK